MYLSLQILGNLGKDPEMRFTPSGQPITSFSVATSHEYKTASGEKVKETIWIRVSAWGKLAEICNQYLAKGSKVFVEGRLTGDKDTGGPRIWNASDGTPKTSFEMTAQTVKFLSPAANKPEQTGATDDFDDAPF
jgi:single-strand DNA-binding protein